MTFSSFVQELDGRPPAVVENLLRFGRVPSTNALARRIAKECLQQETTLLPSALVAFEQTGGRGRLDRRWESPAGRGVYASLLLPFECIRPLPLAPLAVPVALSREVDDLLGRPGCRIKWPNDLLVGGRKIAGILLETVRAADDANRGALVVGFGLNHGQSADDLPHERATSLRVEGVDLSLGRVAGRLIDRVASILLELGGEEALREEYVERSAHRAGDRLRCRIADETVEGEFDGFDEQGFLRLRTADGTRVIASAEILEE